MSNAVVLDRTGSSRLPPRLAEGNAIQQCWHVLNLHEKRLNRLDGAIVKGLGYTGANKVVDARKVADDARRASQQTRTISRLEARLSALEKAVRTTHADKKSRPSKKNTVQLEVEESA